MIAFASGSLGIHDYLSRWNKRNNLDKLELTVSVGMSEWEDGKTLDEVLDAADQDMYAIKNGPATKPRLAAFNPKVSRHASVRLADRFAQEARPNG